MNADEKDDDKPGKTETPKGPPKGHTLADHEYGDVFFHEHGPDADHDHDDEFFNGPIEENPLWIADNVRLNGVGIDVGSSGTQVIFSRIHLRRLAEDMTSRYFVVKRETLFQSPVMLTPYESETRISDSELGKILDDAYAAAGLSPDDIDAGAVILTGEALRRENSQAIAATVSDKGGDFVCATAGHHMESMLAAFGSGAAKASHDGDKRILNVDIGGGTAKLAILEEGQVKVTAAVHVGGRLQVVDETGRIVRLDPAGRTHAHRAGFDWQIGDTVTSEQLDQVAEGMGADHDRFACGAPDSGRYRQFLSHRSDCGLGANRRGDVLRRRGGIRLWPRGTRFRRYGQAPRHRHRVAACGRRAALAAAGRGRMHPRHRAGRVGIFGAAVGQHHVRVRLRGAVAATQPAGHPAAL